MPTLNIEVTHQVDSRLKSLAFAQGTTKSEIIRKACALLDLAESEKEKGFQIGVVQEDQKNDTAEVVAVIEGL